MRKNWYYLKLKGDEIFFESDQASGKVIKYQRATDSRNRYNIVGIVEISYVSFYGRYLNWLSKRSGVIWMEITKEKFQLEVKDYINKILN